MYHSIIKLHFVLAYNPITTSMFIAEIKVQWSFGSFFSFCVGMDPFLAASFSEFEPPLLVMDGWPCLFLLIISSGSSRPLECTLTY